MLRKLLLSGLLIISTSVFAVRTQTENDAPPNCLYSCLIRNLNFQTAVLKIFLQNHKSKDYIVQNCERYFSANTDSLIACLGSCNEEDFQTFVSSIEYSHP